MFSSRLVNSSSCWEYRSGSRNAERAGISKQTYKTSKTFTKIEALYIWQYIFMHMVWQPKTL